MCHTAELSGSSAHVHMDEGIDVVGLEDVELMEPGEIGSAELRHFNIWSIILAFGSDKRKSRLLSWGSTSFRTYRIRLTLLSFEKHLALLHSLFTSLPVRPQKQMWGSEYLYPPPTWDENANGFLLLGFTFWLRTEKVSYKRSGLVRCMQINLWWYPQQHIQVGKTHHTWTSRTTRAHSPEPKPKLPTPDPSGTRGPTPAPPESLEPPGTSRNPHRKHL